MVKINKLYGGSTNQIIFIVFFVICIIISIIIGLIYYFYNISSSTKKTVTYISTDNIPIDNIPIDNIDNILIDESKIDDSQNDESLLDDPLLGPIQKSKIADKKYYHPKEGLGEGEKLIIGIGGGIALDFIAGQIEKQLFKKSINKGVVSSMMKVKSSFIKTVSNVLIKGAEKIVTSFKFGSKLGTKLTEKAASKMTANIGKKAAEKIAQGVAKQVAQKVAVNATMAVTKSAAMGPVGIGLLAVQGLSMALDFAGVGGYGMLDTWKTIKELLEKESSPPTIVGPLDELYLTPDLTQSQIPNEDEDDLSPNPSKFTSLLAIEYQNIIDNDNEYQNFYNKLLQTINNKYSNATGTETEIKDKISNEIEIKMTQFIETLIPNSNPKITYQEKWISQATDNICISNDGQLMSDGTCMYIKEKCNDSNLSNYGVGKIWSDKQNVCLSVNPVISEICNTNHMLYDPDSGLCQITADMCLTKTGLPTPSSAHGNDIVDECTIPIGLEVCGAIIGEVICKGLDQIFNLNQYNPCEDNKIDSGYLCRDKCDDDYTDRAGICWAETKSLGVPNDCKSDYTLKDGLCYPSCRDGYSPQGEDSGLVQDPNICVKKCSEYNMKNIGGICYGNCPDGYDDTGLMCQAHSYTESLHLAKTDGPRGTTYRTECSKYDDLGYGNKGLCNTWYNCDDGYNKTAGGICTWVGGSSCPDNQQLVGASCYNKCRDGYKMHVAGVCSKDGDLSIAKPSTIPDRYGNGAGDLPDCGGNDNVSGICYSKCPEGKTRIVGTAYCSNDGIAGNGDSYVPRTIPKTRKIPFSTNDN